MAETALRWLRMHPWKTFLIVVILGVAAELMTIPWLEVARLKTENPRMTALMRQRVDEARSEGRKLTITQSWVPLARIPKDVLQEIIVAEDGTFYTHGGIDWFEVQASIEKDVEKRRAVRGASTITQQLAKNLFLSTSKDPVRKAKELIITLLLEHDLSKDRILELYVNEIEWGRGIFGIEAAARNYFGTSASALTAEEGSRLAAVIPSPLRHRPDQDSRYVMRRSQMVLNRFYTRFIAQHETAAGDTALQQHALPDVPGDSIPPLPATADTTDTDEADSDGL